MSKQVDKIIEDAILSRRNAKPKIVTSLRENDIVRIQRNAYLNTNKTFGQLTYKMDRG